MKHEIRRISFYCHSASICFLFKLYEKCFELFYYIILNYIFFKGKEWPKALYNNGIKLH